MTKILKAVKAAHKGFARTRAVFSLSADSVQYANSEISLSIYVETDYLRSLIEWKSLDEFELSCPFETLDTHSDEPPAGYKTISASEWESIAWCAIASDTASVHYVLDGVCIDGSTAIATDGRRMHLTSLGCDFGCHGASRVIPVAAVSAVSELIRIFKDKSVYTSFDYGGSVRIVGECWTITARLAEGRFPDWRKVIPDLNEYRMHALDCDAIRSECQATVKRVKLENKIAAAKLTKSEKSTLVNSLRQSPSAARCSTATMC